MPGLPGPRKLLPTDLNQSQNLLNPIVHPVYVYTSWEQSGIIELGV